MRHGSVVIIDSTGLKVYGKDEWHPEKHDVPAENGGRDQCVCTEKNDKSGDAGLCQSLSP